MVPSVRSVSSQKYPFLVDVKSRDYELTTYDYCPSLPPSSDAKIPCFLIVDWKRSIVPIREHEQACTPVLFIEP
jgi:hypothetical protein